MKTISIVFAVVAGVAGAFTAWQGYTSDTKNLLVLGVVLIAAAVFAVLQNSNG